MQFKIRDNTTIAIKNNIYYGYFRIHFYKLHIAMHTHNVKM